MRQIADHLESVFHAYWPYLLTAIVAVIAGSMIDPISRNDSHMWRMVIASIAVVFLAARVLFHWLDTAKVATQILHGAMVVACVGGVFNYYQFDREVFEGIGDHTDITYYYLNSKYLDELGYFGLYAAMLQADKEESGRHTDHIRQYRDLRDYEVRPVKEGIAHGAKIRDERFTPERWELFKTDAKYFLDRLDRNALRSNFFVDHGYNPPPTWSIVGGTIANWTPVEQIGWIAHVDTVLVVAMFALVSWAFGFEPMLFGLLFFCVTFSGRWPILGQSLMRFDWVAALVVGVCFLKKERYFPAGAFMAYAALNRIFPAIFFAPWLFAAVSDYIRDRKVHPRHIQLTAGAVVCTLLLAGAAMIDYGPSVFKSSAKNLVMHNESYSSHRVGLGDLLVYRGETTRAQINEGGGIAVKEKTVQTLQPLLKGLGLLALAWIALYVWRTRREEWALIGLAILPFYCITNPQINYYNLRLILILWHAARLDQRPSHRVLLAILLLTEVATQETKVLNLDRYTTTTTTSIGLAVYLLVLVGWMALEISKGRGEPDVASPKIASEPATS